MERPFAGPAGGLASQTAAMPGDRAQKWRTKLFWALWGSQGLRAGWAILLFVGLFVGLIVLLRTLFPGLHPPMRGEIPIGVGFKLEISQLAVVAAATAIMASIEHKPLSAYGLADSRPTRHLLAGWVAGFVCLSAAVGLMLACGVLSFDGPTQTLSSALFYASAGIAGFLLLGIAEETITRGYLLATLARGVGFWPAAMLTSLLFAALHVGNHGENVIGTAQVFIVGMAFCVLLRATGSLWFGIGVHAAWDWGQSCLYGMPDSGNMVQGHVLTTHARGAALLSGGTDGAEGSLLATPAIVLTVAAVAWAFRGRQPRQSAAPAGEHHFLVHNTERRRPGLDFVLDEYASAETA